MKQVSILLIFSPMLSWVDFITNLWNFLVETFSNVGAFLGAMCRY